MSNPCSEGAGSPDFAAFLGQLETEARAEAVMLAAAAQFQAQLESYGESFLGLTPRLDDEVGLPLAFFQAVEAEYLLWRRECESEGEVVDSETAHMVYEQILTEMKGEGARKMGRLWELAALHSMQSVMAEQATGPIPDAIYDQMKQQLQISLIEDGSNPAWLEVVDRAFPGASLPPEEVAGAVFALQVEKVARSAEHHLRTEALVADLSLWLTEHGVEIDVTARGALSSLAALKSLNDHINAHLAMGPRVVAIDDARAILEARGLTAPAWQGLVQAYFNPPAADV